MAIVPLGMMVSGFHFHLLLQRCFHLGSELDTQIMHIIYLHSGFLVLLLEFHCFFNQLEYMGTTLERKTFH